MQTSLVWAMGGLAAVLAILLKRGRIRIERGWAGWTLPRFGRLERALHWLLALSFIVLALTGLNAAYGRYVLPHLGGDTFADIALWARWLHEGAAVAFMAALGMTLLMWIPYSLPGWRDVVWLAKGGGLLVAGVHPPAWKFNIGQKLMFWLVMAGGLWLSLSGLALLSKQTGTVSKALAAVNGLAAHVGLTPWLATKLSFEHAIADAAAWHGAGTLALLAVVIVHVYLRTLGIEGAFSAMASGEVDANWARQHHSLWAEREIGKIEAAVKTKAPAQPMA